MKIDVKYPDINRIDWSDYLASYPDLKAAFGHDVVAARDHWIHNGKHEGRHVKLRRVDYNLLKDTIVTKYTQPVDTHRVNIVTSLYHEHLVSRMKEYCLTLSINAASEFIENIVVFWDTETGPIPQEIDQYMKTNDKIHVLAHAGRPSFHTLLMYCNDHESNNMWCICNGDIVITNDVHKLQHINMSNKLLALTRWEFVSERDISVFHVERCVQQHLHGPQPNMYSQDTWCVKKGLNIPADCGDIHMGTILCDSRLSDCFKHNNISVFNPCLDIKTLHVHLQNNRSQTYNKHHPGCVECCDIKSIV